MITPIIAIWFMFGMMEYVGSKWKSRKILNAFDKYTELNP